MFSQKTEASADLYITSSNASQESEKESVLNTRAIASDSTFRISLLEIISELVHET